MWLSKGGPRRLGPPYGNFCLQDTRWYVPDNPTRITGMVTDPQGLGPATGLKFNLRTIDPGPLADGRGRGTERRPVLRSAAGVWLRRAGGDSLAGAFPAGDHNCPRKNEWHVGSAPELAVNRPIDLPRQVSGGPGFHGDPASDDVAGGGGLLCLGWHDCPGRSRPTLRRAGSSRRSSDDARPAGQQPCSVHRSGASLHLCPRPGGVCFSAGAPLVVVRQRAAH